jgi:hypothetical protein
VRYVIYIYVVSRLRVNVVKNKIYLAVSFSYIGYEKKKIIHICSKHKITDFFIIKPTRCTNFANLLWHETTCFGQSLCLQTCMTYTIAESTVNEILMMDRETVQNM